jgi:hypothetical protein
MKETDSVAPAYVNKYSEGLMVDIGLEFQETICHYCKTTDEMNGSVVTWALVYSLDKSGELQVYVVFRGTQTVLDGVIDVSALPMAVPFTDTNSNDWNNGSLHLHSGIYLGYTGCEGPLENG